MRDDPSRDASPMTRPTRRPAHTRVAVVIPTFNDANFLKDALQSVADQSVPAHEIIVVDDGSDVSPVELAVAHRVRLLRQDNRGLASARNAGLRAAESDKIIFLDADDLLKRNAISAGITAFNLHPDAALVYGGFNRVDTNLQISRAHDFTPMRPDSRSDLLRANCIAMIGAAMFDRQKLLASGGFDTSLGMCEDWDAYLRLSRSFSIYSHAATVAAYRQRSHSLSTNRIELAKWASLVREKERRRGLSDEDLVAWRAGKAAWERAYGIALPDERGQTPKDSLPGWVRQMNLKLLLRTALRNQTGVIFDAGRRMMGRLQRPAVGAVRLGDLNRIKPISSNFGYDRGTPIDRFFIEQFLSDNLDRITGRVLEIGDSTYARRFGRNLESCDVLNFRPDTAETTIVGDLSNDNLLPANHFDCAIITQTLHLIFELDSAVRNIHAAMRPGGVVLATVPGISPIDRGEWASSWCWSMTENAVYRLFSTYFDSANVTVAQFGNVYAATCFLHGLALEEVDRDKLRAIDPAFPVVVAVRAVR